MSWSPKLGFARQLPIIAAWMAVPATLLAANYHPRVTTVPNTFSPGTTIQSAQVNANFSALATAIDGKQAPLVNNCSAGSGLAGFDASGSPSCSTFSVPGHNHIGETWSDPSSVASPSPTLTLVKTDQVNRAPALRAVEPTPSSFVTGGPALSGECVIPDGGQPNGSCAGVAGTSPSNANGQVGVHGVGFTGVEGDGSVGVAGISSDAAGAGVAAVSFSAGPALTVSNTTNSGPAILIGQGGIQVYGAGADSPTVAFVHTAASGNTSADYTLLDNLYANSNPNALVYVTQNWNPSSGTGVYNAHPVGVFYATGYSKWAIFNEDQASMTLGASFNVLVIQPTP